MLFLAHIQHLDVGFTVVAQPSIGKLIIVGGISEMSHPDMFIMFPALYHLKYWGTLPENTVVPGLKYLSCNAYNIAALELPGLRVRNNLFLRCVNL